MYKLQLLSTRACLTVNRSGGLNAPVVVKAPVVVHAGLSYYERVQRVERSVEKRIIINNLQVHNFLAALLESLSTDVFEPWTTTGRPPMLFTLSGLSTTRMNWKANDGQKFDSTPQRI